MSPTFRPDDQRFDESAESTSANESSVSDDAADQETIALLRCPTKLETVVEPRVIQLIDRLTLLGDILGGVGGEPRLADATLHGRSTGLLGPSTAGDALPQVPDFKLLSILGKGGMGTVYLAEEVALGRRVALKLIDASVAANSVARAGFVREARALAAVVHDNVMPIYRVGECQAGLYFAMPLLEGESLADRLERTAGPLPVDEATQILRQIATGLQAIHGQGIVHRDIKPSNIWLEATQSVGNSKQTRVRILDFGVAHDVGPADRTRTLYIVGTPGYMAPEQAAGGHVDARTDLFAFGALAYRMLTDKMAFEGDTLFAVLTELALHDPKTASAVNPLVPLPISRLIERLLKKRFEERPKNATEVLGALGDYAPPSASSWQERIRNFAPALLVAAIAAAIVITVVNQKGEQATLAVPDGTHAEVDAAGNIRVEVPGGDKPGKSAAFPPLDNAWRERFDKLTATAQRDAIASELVRRNPGYDGMVYMSDEKPPSTLTNLGVFTDRVRDISPLAAARSLTNLQLASSTSERGGIGRLTSLEPLAGLNLQFLDIQGNPEIKDLSPLAGMQLNWLNVSGTGLQDLSSLSNVELTGGLLIERTAVSDLAPIASKPLLEVHCAGSKVRDLKPLAGMRLIIVTMPAGSAPWTVLADMPLRKLHFTADEHQDINIFRRMKTLKEINGRTAEEFWRQFDEQRKNQ